MAGSGGNGSEPTTREAFRGLAGHLVTGVSVVVARLDGEPVAATAGSVVAASWDPPLLAVFFGAGSRMATAIAEAGRFTVNILGETDPGLARRFARPDRALGWSALADVGLMRRDPAPPVLAAAIAWADCALAQTIRTGDHHCYVGEVLDLDRHAEDDPLVYYRGRFRRLGTAVAPADWTAIDAGDLAAMW